MYTNKKGDFIIRQLVSSVDFDELIQLSRDFFQEYESNNKDFFALDALSEDNITEYFSSFVNSDTKKAFLAYSEGHVIGYITVYIKEQPTYWSVKKVGDISGLMVHKDYRNKGLGSRLLSEAKAFFGDMGVRYYTVYTSVNNSNAINLYRKCGMMSLNTTLLGDTIDI